MVEKEGGGLSPESQKKFDKMVKSIPDREKYLRDQRRLIDLAKSSMRAGVNADFLELQEVRLSREEGEFELVKLIADVVNKPGKENGEQKSV